MLEIIIINDVNKTQIIENYYVKERKQTERKNKQKTKLKDQLGDLDYTQKNNLNF